MPGLSGPAAARSSSYTLSDVAEERLAIAWGRSRTWRRGASCWGPLVRRILGLVFPCGVFCDAAGPDRDRGRPAPQTPAWILEAALRRLIAVVPFERW